MLLPLVALLAWTQDIPQPPRPPQFPPHYGPRSTTCPVGGERFDAPALMHYSTYGALPDGQPFGSIQFPILLPECPSNGLVIYKQFEPAEVARLEPLVAGDAYKALRTRETDWYRAWWLADALGDSAEAPWLLLSATWEAKNRPDDAARVQRYNTLFVERVQTLAPSDTELDSIALRARAANALRELGRFTEAETLRASIHIAPDAGGSDEQAPRSREGWTAYLAGLAAPIARGDTARTPIDLLPLREQAFKCLGKELAAKWEREAPPPLTAFEVQYCAAPSAGLATELASVRESLKD